MPWIRLQSGPYRWTASPLFFHLLTQRTAPASKREPQSSESFFILVRVRKEEFIVFTVILREGGVMTVEPCLFHSFGNDCRVSEEGRGWTCSPLWKQDTGTIMHRVACLCGPSLRKGARRESYLQLRRITKDVGRSKWVTIHHAVQVWHTSASLPTAG